MKNQEFPKGILPVLPVTDIDLTASYFIKRLQFSENFRQKSPEGKSTDSQLTFEGSTLMLNLNPEKGLLEGGGIYLWIRLFDTDINHYYDRLVAQDVTIVEPIRDQFWGDRSFVIKDCNNYSLAFNQAVANKPLT